MYRKNTSGQFVGFQMVLTSSGAIATGLSPTARRCIDGTFAAATGTVTEDTGTGGYKFAMSQADTNGNDISFWFTATGAIPVCVNIVTTACDPTTATNFGITALPAVASGSAGAVIISGTGTAALSVSSGLVTLAGVTHSGAVIPTVTTVTNQLTAAAIATGIWQDTTAGDFTTALSVGKSLMNGVALGTGLTVNDITTKTGYSLSQSFPSNFSSLGISAGGHITTVDTLTTYTGNTVQTGDAYARLGAPAGASISADIAAVKTDTAAVKVQTDKMTFTVANQIDANPLSINGSSTAAANLAKSAADMGRGTCTTGGSTTSITTSAFSPGGASIVSGQFIGRTVIFDGDTTTASLRGQATNITANSSGATPTFTVTALTTAPSSGDTFSVV